MQKVNAFIHEKTTHHTNNITRALSVFASLFALLLLSSCASKYTQETSDILLEKNANLVVQTQSRMDLSLFDNSKDWNGYNELFITPPTVTFSEHWLRDHRKNVSNQYKEMIKTNYAKLLLKSLNKIISDSTKYTLVDKPTQNSLILESKIEDLIIYGPETIARSINFVNHAGLATFYAEIKNPQGSIIAAVKDRKETKERGTFRPERTSRVFNSNDFRLLMEKWAERLLQDIER